MKKWSIYNPETKLIEYAVFSEEQPANSTELMVTSLMAKPKYDEATKTIVETGSASEIAAKTESFSLLQPRLRVNRSTPITLNTTWQDIVFNGTSTRNVNLFPVDSSTGKKIVNYDTTTNLFKFSDPLAANYPTTIYPRVTASVLGIGTTLQYRMVVPNGGGQGVDSSFPFPDSDGYADMYYIGLKGGQTYRTPIPVPMYLTDNIRKNGIKLQMRISEALAGMGTVTLNEIVVLIQG